MTCPSNLPPFSRNAAERAELEQMTQSRTPLAGDVFRARSLRKWSFQREIVGAVVSSRSQCFGMAGPLPEADRVVIRLRAVLGDVAVFKRALHSSLAARRTGIEPTVHSIGL
jgi:hypothetical protein